METFFKNVIIIFLLFSSQLNGQELNHLDSLIQVKTENGQLYEALSLNNKLDSLSKVNNDFYHSKKSFIHAININFYLAEVQNPLKDFEFVNSIYTNNKLLFYYYKMSSKNYNYNRSIELQFIKKAINLSKEIPDFEIEISSYFLSLYYLYYSELDNQKKLDITLPEVLTALKQNYTKLRENQKINYHFYRIRFNRDQENIKAQLDSMRDFLLPSENYNAKITYYFYLANYYKSKGDTVTHDKLIQKQVTLTDSTDTFYYKSYPLSNEMITHFHKKRYKQSFKFGNKVLYGLKARNPTLKFYTYEVLAGFYKDLGMYDSAYFLLKEKNSIQDTIHNDKNKFAFETLENEISYAQLKEEKNKTKFQFILLIVSILIGFVLIYLYLIQKQKNALGKLNNALQKSNARLNDYVALISHDLTAPFTSIASLIDITPFNNENKDNLELISKIANHNIEKIKDILVLYKYQSLKKEDLQKVEVNLYNLIHKIIKLNFKTDPNSRIEIDNKIPKNHISCCNLSLFSELIQNIIENAINYSKKSLTPRLLIDMSEFNDFYLYKFTDFGIGIPQKNLDTIFLKGETFGKGKTQSGFGLFFCRQIVENFHGGKIWCESIEGEFTTFFVRMPK